MNSNPNPIAAYRTTAGEHVTVTAAAGSAIRHEADCAGCGWKSGAMDADEAKYEANRHALGCAAVSPDHWPGMQQAQGR